MKTATTTEPRTGHTANSRAGAVVAADTRTGDDMEKTAKRTAAEEEYAKTYAEAVAAGITPAKTPELVGWTFAETDAEIVAEIEDATRKLRDAIERRIFNADLDKELDAEVAQHEERGQRKSQSQHDRKIKALREENKALRLKLSEAERDKARLLYILDQQGK